MPGGIKATDKKLTNNYELVCWFKRTQNYFFIYYADKSSADSLFRTSGRMALLHLSHSICC